MGIGRNPQPLKTKGELKAVDTIVDTNIVTPGTYDGVGIFFGVPTATLNTWLLNDIGNGSAFYQRVGRKISMKSLELCLQIYPQGLVAGTQYPSQILRLMVVYDTQANGTTPVITDILNSVNGTGTGWLTAQQALNQINLNNRDRFQLIRNYKMVTPLIGSDTVDGMKNTAAEDQQNWRTTFDDYIKLKGLAVQFKADDAPLPFAANGVGRIGNFATGALYLIPLSNAGPGAIIWKVVGTTRLRYYDP